jgi:small multidrug resistance pump
MNAFLLLILAIVSEVIGSAALKASEGFTRLGPSVVVAVGYGLAFYLLASSLRQIPLGSAYAIWSGLGTVGTAIIGVFVFREAFGAVQLAGMALIVVGVAVLNLASGGAGH